MINEIFILGNIMLLIASFPLILTIWKNHKLLLDYNPIGSVMTFMALIMFWLGYAMMNNWIAILINIPTVILWGMASWYSIRKNGGGIKNE